MGRQIYWTVLFSVALLILSSIAAARRQASSPLQKLATSLISKPSTNTCSWVVNHRHAGLASDRGLLQQAGHCAGASCGSDDDCDGALTCVNRVCGGTSSVPPSPPSPSRSPQPTPSSSKPSPSSPSCSWVTTLHEVPYAVALMERDQAGHCLGATCSSDNDCSDVLICASGRCAGSHAPSSATPAARSTPPPSLGSASSSTCTWVRTPATACGSSSANSALIRPGTVREQRAHQTTTAVIR